MGEDEEGFLKPGVDFTHYDDLTDDIIYAEGANGLDSLSQLIERLRDKPVSAVFAVVSVGLPYDDQGDDGGIYHVLTGPHALVASLALGTLEHMRQSMQDQEDAKE